MFINGAVLESLCQFKVACLVGLDYVFVFSFILLPPLNSVRAFVSPLRSLSI